MSNKAGRPSLTFMEIQKMYREVSNKYSKLKFDYKRLKDKCFELQQENNILRLNLLNMNQQTPK